jgi:hypothetical protein
MAAELDGGIVDHTDNVAAVVGAFGLMIRRPWRGRGSGSATRRL